MTIKSRATTAFLLLLLALSLPAARAQYDPDNPPVPCPCCSCYDFTNVKITTPSPVPAFAAEITADSTECLRVQPTAEGELKFNIALPAVVPNCLDCANSSLSVEILHSDGRVDQIPAQANGAVNLKNWVCNGTMTVRILCRINGQSEISQCAEFCVSANGCDSCSSSGTCEPTGEIGTGTGVVGGSGGSVDFSIPVGTSNFGDIKANLVCHLDNPADFLRSKLRLSASPGIVAASDLSGLTSVTTNTATAAISGTNPCTISLSTGSGIFREVVLNKSTNGTTHTLTLTSTYYPLGNGGVGTTRVMSWTKSGEDPTSTWTFTDGDGIAKVVKTTTEVSGVRTATVQTYENPGSGDILVSHVVTLSEKIGGRWKPVKRTVGTGLVTTWSYYAYGQVTAPGSYIGVGQVREVVYPDASYESHAYDDGGGASTHTTVRPFADGSATETRVWTPGNPSSTLHTTVDKGGLASARLSEQVLTYNLSDNTLTTKTYNDPDHFLTESTEYYPSSGNNIAGIGGKVKKVTHQDGTVSTHAYVSVGGDRSLKVVTAATEATYENVTEGSKIFTRMSTKGFAVESKTSRVASSGALDTEDWIVGEEITDRDHLGRPLLIRHFPTGASSQAWTITRTYNCCGLLSETDQYGNRTVYAYDALKRRIKSNTLGVTHATVYNGLTTSQYRYPETPAGDLLVANPANEISRTVADLAGNTVEQWGPSHETGNLEMLSSFAVTYRNPGTGSPINLNVNDVTIGKRIVETAMLRDTITAQQTTSYLCDGRIYQSTGSLAPSVRYSYGASTTSQSYLDGTIERETSVTTTDWAGRTTQTAKGGITQAYTYYNATAPTGSKGRTKAVADADGVRTLNAYNNLGERIASALDLDTAVADTNHSVSGIDFTKDRITVTETAPGNQSGFGALMTTTKIYATAGSAVPTIASTSARTPDGLRSWSSSLGATSQSLSGFADGAGTSTAVNWALSSLGSTADQSSTDGTAVASLAIDGNTDGTVANGSVSSTEDQMHSWWKVDLGRDRLINQIILFNRSTQQEYLSNFKVEILAADGTTVIDQKSFHIASGNVMASEIWTLESTATGRIIKISLLGENNDGNGHLSLAEVQINQFVTVGANAITWSLAGATATQSSTDGTAAASRAVDGNTDGLPANNSISATLNELTSWWEANLNQSLPVNRVVLYNRADSNANYLSNFKVTLTYGSGQTLTKEFYTTDGFAKPEETWELGQLVQATKLRVELLGLNRAGNRILSLAEVRLLLDPAAAGTAPQRIHRAYAIAPDGTSQSSISVDGRPSFVESRSFAGDLISFKQYGYDTLGRVTRVTDSRTGTTVTAYRSQISDAVASVTDPGNRTTAFTYDHRGNRTEVNAPDTKDATGADLWNVTTTTYDSYGRVESITGDQAYPVSYTYDYAGRLQTMTTTGNVVTTWNYYPTTGLLKEKLDAESQGPIYTYTPAGRLGTRTWARNVPNQSYKILTEYGYTAGQLTSVTYNDDTPDLVYTLDRGGRIVSVTRGGNTHATYTYDPGDLALNSEELSQDTQGSYTLNRYRDPMGRPLSVQTTSIAYFWTFTTGYGYDAAGRLDKVWDQPLLDEITKAPVGDATFTYGYLANSYGLVQTVTGPAHTVTNTWKSDRDVLDTKTNTVTATNPLSTPSSFAYGVNALGQRENIGPVLDGNTPVSTYTPKWAWGYNERGELVEADDQGTGDNNPRAYQYDAIGNREKTVNGLLVNLENAPVNYIANPLNQYTMANGIELPDGDPVPELPAYDADGNYQSGPLPMQQDIDFATLAWDAENRLVKITKFNGDVIDYAYDHLSRRISKTVTPNAGSPDTTYYSYDGWNLVTEICSCATVRRGYVWGMDLSGGTQGAGGVGGLLAVSEVAYNDDQNPYLVPFYPTFDGNGNVSEYLNGVGTVVAHYEYDAFGNTVYSSGSRDDDFPLRFSTKYLDAESGFYYYGYRFYDPLTGRWPSRDPIGENWRTGEYSEYCYVNNEGVGDFDILGRESAEQKRSRAKQSKAENGNNRINNQNRRNTERIPGNRPAPSTEPATPSSNLPSAVAGLPDLGGRVIVGAGTLIAIEEKDSACRSFASALFAIDDYSALLSAGERQCCYCCIFYMDQVLAGGAKFGGIHKMVKGMCSKELRLKESKIFENTDFWNLPGYHTVIGFSDICR